MRPEMSVYFRELVRTLAEEIAPRLPTSFEQGAAMRYALLTQAASEEFDRAAARRIEENAALRALFERAALLVAAPALAARLREASSSVQASFRVSDLDRENCGLRALLVDLHAQIEQQEGEPARALEAEIWSELAASTRRRALSIGRF